MKFWKRNINKILKLILSTINLLEQGYKEDLKIFTDHQLLFTAKLKKEINEKTQNPITLWISKLAAEKYWYLVKNRLKKVHYIILFKPLWSKQSDLGEVVYKKFHQRLFDKNVITKHGNGKQIRDFLY